MAVQAETGESASDSGIKQVEVEAAAPISEVRFGNRGCAVAQKLFKLSLHWKKFEIP